MNDFPSTPSPLDAVAGLSLPARLAVYARMSGPGWLQGAITLGAGSLAGSLFIGILAGPHFLWIQPFAMICGVIMLSAIAYVTLSTGEQPMKTISLHLSPLLAIAWAVATIVANVVFALPQFSLSTSTIMQNLAPALSDSAAAPWWIGGLLALTSLGMVWAYESGHRGLWIFEMTLKVLVAIVVLSFFAVVAMLIVRGQVDLGAMLAGLVPHPGQMSEPTAELAAFAAATGPHEKLWSGIIAGQQRAMIIAAGGSAVGINMTFLLPYSLLRRGWGRRHRELSVFDLLLGLFIPFSIATSCLVIAAGSQFYTRTHDVLAGDGSVRPSMQRAYAASVDAFLLARDGDDFTQASDEAKEAARAALPEADRIMAAMLAPRDAGQLSATLEPILGRVGANLVFGAGVVAMGWSSIIMMILMNGLAVGALLKRITDRRVFLIGAIMPAISGFLAPVIWTGASRAALAIPAAVVATVFLPVAYFTFLLLMNSRGALGEHRPRGAARWIVNLLMIVATVASFVASAWGLQDKGWIGALGMLGLIVLFLFGLSCFIRPRQDRRGA